jgi:hypothetical protein
VKGATCGTVRKSSGARDDVGSEDEVSQRLVGTEGNVERARLDHQDLDMARRQMQ